MLLVICAPTVFAANADTFSKKAVESAMCGASWVTSPLKCAALVVLSIAVFLLELAATLFSFAADTKNITTIFQGVGGMNPIYTAWAFLRDILNMGFIMMLLFSAFCTIFQIESYNYKKMLWKIVLMALLVNFSYPITRFIIDISHVFMYTLLRNFFVGDEGSAGAILVKIAASGGVAKLIAATVKVKSVTVILIVGLFLCLLAISFIAIGALLLIRLVVLAILLMLSSVAFAGAVIPFLSSQVSKWWDNLFRYAFFGPIMIFGIYIAIKFMEGVATTLGASADTAAGGGTDATIIGKLILLIIPIVLLWVLIGVAQSMSISGAGAVVSRAQKAMKATILAPAKVAKWGIKKSGISGGIKKGYEDVRKSGKIFGFDNKFTRAVLKDNQAEREAQLAGGVVGGKTGWQAAVKDKKAEEFRKKYKEESDKYDRTDATKANGLVDEILKANLHDPKTRNKDSMKVAAMLHNLKTGDKKDEFELKIREKVVASGATAGMSDADRELHLKKEIAKNWKILNDKARQAHDVATTGATTGPVINKTYATAPAAGGTDVWT